MIEKYFRALYRRTMDESYAAARNAIAEVLRAEGYVTFCTGKWHLAPAEESTPAGPFHRWPLGRGFERYYGFLGGETHQYYPELVYDNHQVEPPAAPEDGYHVTEDLVDKAISFIADAKQVAPNKPFFMYFAPGAMHAPHHVTNEWSDAYAGKFHDGWEAYREQAFAKQKELGIVPADAELSRHDPDVPEWASLSDDERKLYARMMEVFAGFLTHTDHHVGRLLDFIEQLGELDNTIVMVISDNGASSEGGPHGSVNETLFFNNVPESLEENLAMIDQSVRHLDSRVDEVLFDSGESTLKPEGIAILKKVGGVLKKTEGRTIEVQGHTDDQGAANANQELSEARAQAVLDRLVELGVDADRLTARGADGLFRIGRHQGRAQGRSVRRGRRASGGARARYHRPRFDPGHSGPDGHAHDEGAGGRRGQRILTPFANPSSRRPTGRLFLRNQISG